MKYMQRLHSNNFINKSKDYAFPEFVMQAIQYNNADYLTSNQTYYFTITTGDKKVKFTNQTELFQEPKTNIKRSLGFDTDIVQNLRLLGESRKTKARGRSAQSTRYTLFEYIGMCIKTM